MSATTAERCNTTPKQQGGVTGKGFVQGDARINRKGRPRSYDELRKLAQAIANETTTDNQGNETTTAVAILRSWARSKQPSLQIAFMEAAYGKPPPAYSLCKVPNKLETNPLEKETTIILRHAHERPEREVDGRIPARPCGRPKLGNEVAL
jgi:hypothetical protein